MFRTAGGLLPYQMPLQIRSAASLRQAYNANAKSPTAMYGKTATTYLIS